MPDRLAVIGDPIAHSLSPAMQGAALLAAGLYWEYEAVHVTPANLPDWVAQARVHYRGWNATIPHKRTLLPLMDEIAESARRVGAVNTVLSRSGRLTGYNTDPDGVIAALSLLAVDLRGLPAVLFGAGGAARAAAMVLADGEARLTVINRDPDRAAALAAEFGGKALPAGNPAVPAAIAAARLLINATPLGMSHLAGCCPLPDGIEPHPAAAVLDMVYGQDTPLLARARAAGCRTADGLEMLVGQGAASFRLWTGLDPDLNVMRAACRRRLEMVSC